jgi:hypothetical protein
MSRIKKEYFLKYIGSTVFGVAVTVDGLGAAEDVDSVGCWTVTTICTIGRENGGILMGRRSDLFYFTTLARE